MTAIAEHLIITTMPPKTTAGKGKKIDAASSAAKDAHKKVRGRPKAVPGKRAKKSESYAIYIYVQGRQTILFGRVHLTSCQCQLCIAGAEAGPPLHRRLSSSFINDLFERIAAEASKLAHYNKR